MFQAPTTIEIYKCIIHIRPILLKSIGTYFVLKCPFKTETVRRVPWESEILMQLNKILLHLYSCQDQFHFLNKMCKIPFFLSLQQYYYKGLDSLFIHLEKYIPVILLPVVCHINDDEKLQENNVPLLCKTVSNNMGE